MGMADEAWSYRVGEHDGGVNMAHELTHTLLGISHAPDCGSYSPHYDNYPRTSGRLADTGFDGTRLYTPSPPMLAYDYMSYCYKSKTGAPMWVSTYVYQKLIDDMFSGDY